MIRNTLLLLLMISSLSASYIKDISILEIDDVNATFKDIKNSNNFRNTTLPLIQKTDKSYFIKLTLDKTALVKQQHILKFTSFFSKITLEKQVSLGEQQLLAHPIILLNSQNIEKTFFIKLENLHGYINFDMTISPQTEYLSKVSLENIIHGLVYGVTFTMFLCYLILFVFNRKMSYLYYSLTQLFVLGIIIYEVNIFNKNYAAVELILFYLFSLFSNLFVQSFFNTKKEHTFLHKLLKYVIIVNTVDLLIIALWGNSILYNYLPYSTSWIIYLIVGTVSLVKGNKSAIFFLLAWFFLVFYFFIVELQMLYLEEQFISSFESIIHFVVPFESIVLVFALSNIYRVSEKEYLKQREIIYHQNKLASMGEMIENISHQWKQPLTQLSYILMAIKTAFKHDKLSLEYLENKTTEAFNQLSFMSNTITDFSNFLSLQKEKEAFFIVDEIDNVLSLMKDSFSFFSIEVKVNYDQNHLLRNYKGELSHVLFNLLNNAKDEFTKKKIEKPKITIDIKKENSNILISILDNAGGVDEKIAKKIFQSYFTTKENGLGIGLYMSKKIVEESILGKLTFENKEEGAEFCILVPISF